jgi:hypothetical protein
MSIAGMKDLAMGAVRTCHFFQNLIWSEQAETSKFQTLVGAGLAVSIAGRRADFFTVPKT